MPGDSVTEVTSQSWFSRISGAIKGILVGFILFIVAFPLLFWNEGRAVKRYKTLKEGSGAVVSVTPDRVDAANEGRLIHVTGKAETKTTLADPVFGVSADALRMKRVVEMFQWTETSRSETRKKLGGGTETVKTYSYSKTWSDTPIRSGEFKEPTGHQNPESIPYESTDLMAPDVTLGAFALPPSLVGMIDNFESLPVGRDASRPAEQKDRATLHDAGFYIGSNPTAPQIGDVRVKFRVARPTEVSVIGKQVGSTFEPYRTRAGGDIELLQTGVYTAEAMFREAQASNKSLTWILRLVGFIVMFVGLTLMLKPLSVLADVLPILGGIVGAGTGLISFLVAGLLSLITVAMAWIVYRPLLGLALIVVAVGLAVAITGKLKSSRGAAAPASR
jgi:hypothetical protein